MKPFLIYAISIYVTSKVVPTLFIIYIICDNTFLGWEGPRNVGMAHLCLALHDINNIASVGP